MVTSKQGIEWYLANPERLLMKKPFVRGGVGVHYTKDDDNANTNPNELKRVKGTEITYNEISQDVYLSEINPYLHCVNDVPNMPKITVTMKNGHSFETNDILITSGYQKVIHATQVQNLSHNPMEFSLCKIGDNKNRGFLNGILEYIKGGNDRMNSEEEILFSELQELWRYENEESRKADIYSTQKSMGDVGVLFQGNEKNIDNIRRKVLRYKDGYNIIPNYDEYGNEIAVSIYYTINEGSVECLDTYCGKNVYRFEKNLNAETEEEKNWILMDGYPMLHGYSKTNLLYHRGVVAWEYVQSYITIIELIENVIAMCQKYYSTFLMAVYGNVDDKTLINMAGDIQAINIANPTGVEKVEVLSFPENMSAYKYLDHLKEQVEILSSTTLGISKNQTNGSDSRGGAMTMKFKADIALAKQTILDFADFWSAYVYLFQEAMDMKYYKGKEMFRKLKIKPNPRVWTPISDSLLIDNIAIAYKEGFLSLQTAIEKSPLSEKDELLRKLNEKQMAFEQEVEKMKKEVVDNEGNNPTEPTPKEEDNVNNTNED